MWLELMVHSIATSRQSRQQNPSQSKEQPLFQLPLNNSQTNLVKKYPRAIEDIFFIYRLSSNALFTQLSASLLLARKV